MNLYCIRFDFGLYLFIIYKDFMQLKHPLMHTVCCMQVVCVDGN